MELTNFPNFLQWHITSIFSSNIIRRTYILPLIVLSSFFFSFFFFFAVLISDLAERNSTTIGHMLGSKCSLKTHVQNLGYPLPYTNREPQNHLFEPLRNLTANLTAYLRSAT